MMSFDLFLFDISCLLETKLFKVKDICPCLKTVEDWRGRDNMIGLVRK